MIEHTLAWAKDWFEGEFKQLPETINAYLSKTTFLAELAQQSNTQIETLFKVSWGRGVGRGDSSLGRRHAPLFIRATRVTLTNTHTHHHTPPPSPFSSWTL